MAFTVCLRVLETINAGVVATQEDYDVQTRFRVDEKKRTPFARTGNTYDVI